LRLSDLARLSIRFAWCLSDLGRRFRSFARWLSDLGRPFSSFAWYLSDLGRRFRSFAWYLSDLGRAFRSFAWCLADLGRAFESFAWCLANLARPFRSYAWYLSDLGRAFLPSHAGSRNSRVRPSASLGVARNSIVCSLASPAGPHTSRLRPRRAEDALISLAWWGCPLSATVVAHALIRRYTLAVVASVSLATPLWILLVWLDGRGYVHPEVLITGAIFAIFALATSLFVGGAMRLLRSIHAGRTARHALAAGCAAAVATYLAVMVWAADRLGRTKLPPTVAGYYLLQVPRERASSDALNSDRDLTITRTTNGSRRIDDSTSDWVSFRRVERTSDSDAECYKYEADRCNGSVCLRDDRHIALTACAPGESPPCIDPLCTAFAGDARRW
jgi:hypothetical protein